MNYQDYLKSDYWKQRRLAALERAEYLCQLCGEHDSLEVHHLSYERLGNEDPNDLFVICKSHHWMEHNPPPLPVVPPAPVTPAPKQDRCAKGSRIYLRLMNKTRKKGKKFTSALNNYNNHADHCPICKALYISYR